MNVKGAAQKAREAARPWDEPWGTSGSRGGRNSCPEGLLRAPHFLPSLHKCQTAGAITLSLSPGERAPPRAPLPPSGPREPPKGLKLDQGHRTPREEGKGLGLTLFVFSIVSSQHWEHSCCPPNIYHLNFELLCGFSQILHLPRTTSPSLAGPPPPPGGPTGGLKPLSPSSPRNTCQLGWRRSPGWHEFIMQVLARYTQSTL